MKKSVIMLAVATAMVLTCCGGKTAQASGEAKDADSVKVVGGDTAANSGTEADDKTTADNEATEGESVNGEEWDVSVRTFDLDSQDPGPGYEVIIRDRKGKTLTMGERRGNGYPRDMLETFGNVWQADVDFDGHTDVLISLGLEPVSDQVFKRYDAWLYNPEDGKFYCPDTFRDICNPEIDKSDTRILGHYVARDGVTKVYSAHYWQRDGNIQQVGETWTSE